FRQLFVDQQAMLRRRYCEDPLRRDRLDDALDGVLQEGALTDEIEELLWPRLARPRPEPRASTAAEDQRVETGQLGAEIVESHRLAHLVQGLYCLDTGACSPGFEDLVDDARLALDLCTPCADRLQEALERDEEPPFHFHVADAALAIALLQLGYLGLVGVERVVIGEDGIALDRSGVCRPDALGIGVHRHDLLLDGRGGV